VSFSDILNFSDCIGLGLVLFNLTYYDKQLNFPGKIWVFSYFIVFFMGVLTANILGKLLVPNCWIYDSIPLLVSIPIYLYFRALPHSIFFAKINFSAIIIFFAVYLFTWKKVIDLPLNSEYYLYLAFFILINSAGYLLEELKRMRTIPVFLRIEFWFVVSLLFYSCVCSLVWTNLIYLFSNTTSKYTNEKVNLWIVYHNSILFISCLIFLIAISFRRTQPSLR
jgi:hypothetical protein